MDLRLRQLEITYLQNGGIEDGVRLLKALVRGGKVPRHHVELAAIYQHPIAMELIGEPPAKFGHRDEKRVLPLTELRKTNWFDVAPWDCEVYHRRLLAVTQWCFERILEIINSPKGWWEQGVGWRESPVHPTIREQVDAVSDALNYVREILDNTEEHDPEVTHEIFAQIMDYGQEFLSMSDRDLAVNRMMLAVGATVRALDCNNDNGIISVSGPAWACASAAHLDAYLNVRDPDLPENPEQGFGPKVIEGAYTAIAREVVPWLLDPFPFA